MVHGLLPFWEAKAWRTVKLLQTESKGFQVSPHKSHDNLHGKLGKPLKILFATQSILATNICYRHLNSDLQCMCFSEKSTFVSDTHQDPKLREAFHVEVTVLMPSVLDAPTGPSCLLLHLNCPEKKQIKNIFFMFGKIRNH